MLLLALIQGFEALVTNSINLYEWKVVIDTQLLRVVDRLHPGSVPKVGVGLGSRGLPQAVRGTENRLERRHSSACYAAFLPGIGLSATTSAMVLAACSAAVPS